MAKNLTNLNKSKKDIISEEIYNHDLVSADSMNEVDFDISNSVIDKITKLKSELESQSEDLNKSENTKYATINGVKEFNCKDGYVDNLYIEGKTLVNLANTSVSKIGTSAVEYRDDFDKRITNGTFTFINFNWRPVYFDVRDINNPSSFIRKFSVTSGCTTHTLSAGEFIPNFYGYLSDGWTQNDDGLYDLKNSIVILEGVHDYESIAYYFEGLSSTGQGEHIEVLTRTKITDSLVIREADCSPSKYLDENGELITVEWNDWCTSRFIEIKNKYMDCGVYSYPVDHWAICYYDESYNFICNRRTLVGRRFIECPENAMYVRLPIKTGFDTLTVNFFEKLDDQDLLVTLRALPNGVHDTIEKRGNKYYLIKRCEEVTFTGGETITTSGVGNQVDTITFKLTNGLINAIESSNVATTVCDRFLSKGKLLEDEDEEACFQGGAEAATPQNDIRIRILRSRLSAATVDGFRTWLQSNPITVVYQLKTPQIIELYNFNPRTFENNTAFILNTGAVQGDCSFEITNSKGSEIEVLKDKVSSLADNYSNDYTITPLNGWQFTNTTITRAGNHVQINMILTVQGIHTPSAKIATFSPSLKPRTVVICNLMDISGSTIGAIEIVNNYIQVNGSFSLVDTYHGCFASFSYYI